MLSTLFSYFVYEKAIDILFHRISKNFPTNPEIYSKVFINNKHDNLFAILYNVELNESAIELSRYILRFEYMKYSSTEYDWEHELNLSIAIKQPKDEWYEISKEYITKKI